MIASDGTGIKETEFDTLDSLSEVVAKKITDGPDRIRENTSNKKE